MTPILVNDQTNVASGAATTMSQSSAIIAPAPAAIPFPEQVKLDVAYLESQSLWLDITLLLKTVPAVLLGRGAY